MNKRLFAIGDIHGCFDAFSTLVEQKIQIKKSDRIILLGDYIDRGFQSKKVVDYIIELQYKGFDIIPLMGNHEAMLLDAINDDINISKWINSGGSETLKSFNIESPNKIDKIYIDFFRNLNFYHSYNDFLLVHAGFNDVENNPFNDKSFMIRECKKKYNNTSLKNKIIIHGHRPVTLTICNERVLSNSKVINIDTGCVYSDRPGYGILTALELNTKCLFFV